MHNTLLEEIRDATKLNCDIENSKTNINFSSICRHIRCGLKSNIPICCIVFYLLREPLYFFINFTLVKKFIYWYPYRTKCKYNYVPCLICFLFRRVRKLYVCTESDIDCCCKQSAIIILEKRGNNE